MPARVASDYPEEHAGLSSPTMDTDDNAHQGDGAESIYYTPALQRLSVVSTDYQPSIPDMPGAWYSNARKKGARSRPNPFL